MTSETLSIDAPAAEATKKPFQFGIMSLFVLTIFIAIACSTLATLGAAGMIVLLPLFFMLVGIFEACRTRRFVMAGALVIIGGLCEAMLISAVLAVNLSANIAMCDNNLKRIGMALQNYESVHGSLPPACVADAAGTPMHSWRVLILPYLGEQALYDKYDFDQPWNGRDNIKLLDQMPDVFRCRSDSKAESTETSYVVVIGPETMWPGATSLKLADATDGTSRTLLVVETCGSGIKWTEPRDLHTTQMAPAINPEKGQSISSEHGEPVVAFADGHVQRLYLDLTPKQLKALLSRAGRERGDPYEL